MESLKYFLPLRSILRFIDMIPEVHFDSSLIYTVLVRFLFDFVCNYFNMWYHSVYAFVNLTNLFNIFYTLYFLFIYYPAHFCTLTGLIRSGLGCISMKIIWLLYSTFANLKNTYILIDRQTDRHTHTHTHTHADKHTDTQTYRQTEKNRLT